MRASLLLILMGVTSTTSTTKEQTITRQELQGLETLLRRVIGGTEVQSGVWPWLVSLTGKIPTETLFGITVSSAEHFCGASLIDRRWILTAAHCFEVGKNGRAGLKPKYWKARFGDVDRESSLWEDFKGLVGDIINKDEWKDWVIRAQKIIIHPRYNPKDKWKNDIALMKLAEPVPVDPKHVEDIQQVALASGNRDFPRDGQLCVFKGWGCTRNGGRVTDVAFQVTLPKWKDAECSQLWKIPSTTRLCAGRRGSGLGICSGDSGGPLVCRHGTTWYQVGIASFTSAKDPQHYPGVFTRVSAYTDWIRKTIANN